MNLFVFHFLTSEPICRFRKCQIVYSSIAARTSDADPREGTGPGEGRLLQRQERVGAGAWTGTRKGVLKWPQLGVGLIGGIRRRSFQIPNPLSLLFSYTSRCASCIGESARAQWFRHSDGWRSGSSTLGSGSAQGLITSSSSGHKRSPWDSLPSLRQDSSMNDSGYKSARGDSLEQQR